MNARTILKAITPPFITAIARRATGRPPLPPVDPPLVSDALNSIRAWLTEIGWLESAITKTSIDAQGKPIPWFSYPVIMFLEPRINKEMSLFEYGTGNSTIWCYGISKGTGCSFYRSHEALKFVIYYARPIYANPHH